MLRLVTGMQSISDPTARLRLETLVLIYKTTFKVQHRITLNIFNTDSSIACYFSWLISG